MRDVYVEGSDLIIRVIDEDESKILGKVCLYKGTIVFPISAFGMFRNGEIEMQELKHRGEVAKISQNGKFGFRGVDDTAKLIGAFLKLYSEKFVTKRVS